MMERLELALDRLARIPGENLAPTPYLDYFEETAAFLLKALGNEDPAALSAFINAELYPSSFAAPAFAASRLGPEMGPLLSAVYAELMAILPCRLAGDEAGAAALLELYLEIYGDFAGKDLPSPRAVREIFRFYAEDYLPDHTESRIRERVCPERARIGAEEASLLNRSRTGEPSSAGEAAWEERAFGEQVPAEKNRNAEEKAGGKTCKETMFSVEESCWKSAALRERLEAADLSDPAYLLSLDPFAPGTALALAAKCRSLNTETVEGLVEGFADECLKRIRADACRSWRVRTVGLLWPEGAERILLAAIRALEARGLAVTLPRAADRMTLKNDYMSRGFTSASPCPAFICDHRDDIALFLDDNHLTRRRRAAREAYEAVKQEAGVFGGVFELVLPDLAEMGKAGDGTASGSPAAGSEEKPEGASTGVLSLTPAQVRLRESLARSLEDIRSRYEAY